MTEAEQRRENSPLLSDRGVTTIKDTVVSRIAGMGGSASRSAGSLLDSITGSESDTRGVGVEVGSVEAAIDLTMGIDYGKNILGTVGQVRQKITERVHDLTGLTVTELNVTVSEITAPQDDDQDQSRSAQAAIGAGPGFDTRTMRRRESSPLEDPETTEVEASDRTHTEGSSGPVPEEEVRAEGTPVDEDETRRMRVGPDEPSERPETEARASETPTTSETASDETSAAEAPTDETTLTGGTPSGERAARETASDPTSADAPEDQEHDSEVEESRARRRRRREERRGDEG